jgi:uncharacterized 2Fe-2S/4Fe-4S cluster protein (DUF4445 family)
MYLEKMQRDTMCEIRQMKHFKLTFKPDGRQISIHAGATLIEAAGQAGIILNSVCGGKGTCKKCLVILEPEGRQVLACQYHIRSNLTVTIPPGSRFLEQKILSDGIDTQTEISPDIYKKYLPVNSTAPIYGLAVDIGTTTVVAKLIDMRTGRCRTTEATLNPQTRFGDDIISRIAYAESVEKLTELQKIIIDCINDLILKLCEKAAIESKQIHEVCVVGNTTMNHIFLKFPVSTLGRAPYKAYSLDAHDVTPNEIGLKINPDGNVHVVENISGFVGADTIAVAFAADIDSAEEMTLIVDIGTNGELVLGTKDKLYAASCAAGPALEGARITCGSRAAEGAIEAVVVNDDDIDFDVIGNCLPGSICGSGLIDAVAVMLELGIIDKTGRFAEPDTLRDNLPPNIFYRIGTKYDEPAFYLAETVFLTQKDIRQVQLAKAAIRAGTKILQRKLNLKDSDIKHILLAGAFGNYIRKENALRIGLLPNVSPERIRFIGNAAASGAQMILISQNSRDKAKELARKIEYIEIAHEKDFTGIYADCMTFLV